ncbi:type I iterative polyketide synthase, partial [Penicillium cf. griseofulvum]
AAAAPGVKLDFYAFLGELLYLRSLGQLPNWAVFDSVRAPLDLLGVSEQCQKNPIIQGVVLCVHQLVTYLHVEQDWPHKAGSAVAGLCSGILPAAVAASSRDVSAFISSSKEAVRLAFWIGYRVGELSARLGSADWQLHPWSLAVTGLDRAEMEQTLNTFTNNHPVSAQAPLRISSISGNTFLSLTGDSRLLQRLRSDYISSPAHCEPIDVYGLYHGGCEELPTLEAVLQDMKQRNIAFPDISDLVIPLWSAKDGSLLTEKSELDTSFGEYVLRCILIDSSEWAKTWTNIIQSNSKNLTVTTIGPGSYSFLLRASRSIGMDTSLTPRIIDGVIEQPYEPDHDGFAIVGMSVNFPMGATKEQLWHTLENGLSALQEWLLRWQTVNVNSYWELPGKPFSFRPWILQYFPREALSMDPQQKLLLQGAKIALDDAGYVPDATPSFQRDSIGCYIGVATDDYVQNLIDDIDVYYSPGTLRAFLSGKISYAFGLSGPSTVVDTACSSSLTAIYQACRALQNGDCSAAIAGGVNAITSPDMFLGLARAHFLSENGQCKAFDAGADGYSRAEGCGLFIIKRLQDAIDENDRIYGVIKEVEVNQCGNAKSITHPHGPTQAKLFKRLLHKTGYHPSSISVIEAHGTGTQAGDATEVSSIVSVFSRLHPSRNSVQLTSIKSNIGHAEAASGAAGLAKLLLMLTNNKIPPQIGLKSINPRFSALKSDNIHIATEIKEWTPTAGKPRRALLNNFGAAGSNAALVLQESPLKQENNQWEKRRAAYNFLLSAKSADALEKYRLEFIQMLRITPDTELHNVCYTVTARREIYDHRISIVCESTQDALRSLENENIMKQITQPGKRPIIFLCSGQGGCYPGMGKSLLSTAPVFKRAVDECDEVLESLGYSRTTPYLTDGCAPMTPEEVLVVSQVSCFVVEYGLACLWLSFNIQPDFVLGHSLGEYTALAISGAIPLRDALSLVAFRAQLMAEKCKLGRTGMLACDLSVSEIESLLKSALGARSSLEVACINGKTDLVLSGSVEDLSWLAEVLERDGRRYKRLDVSLGFHSAALDPILEALRQFCANIVFSTPKFPIGSCHYGRQLKFEDLTPEYFVKQARGAVQFDALLASISQDTRFQSPLAFIEIGPAPITLPLVKHVFSDSDCLLLPSLRRKQDPWATICNSLSNLSNVHHGIDFREVFAGTNATVTDVPCYPFQQSAIYVPYKERAGVKSAGKNSEATNCPRYFHLLENFPRPGEDPTNLQFETRVASISKYITGHMVGGQSLCPASIYHGMLLEASTVNPITKQGHSLVVQSMIFSRPLLHLEASEERSIRMTLESPTSQNLQISDTTTWKFAFQSVNTVGNDNSIVHCSGQVEYEPQPVTETYLALKGAYVKRQLNHLRSEHIPHNHFQTRMIYQVIFPRVVTYSDIYQTLKELTIVDGSLEAFGSFRSLKIHTAPARDYFRPFMSIHSCMQQGDGVLVGEAYAIDSDGTVVAAVEGMHFQKLNLASFKRHLSRFNSSSLASTNTPIACPPIATAIEDKRPRKKRYPVAEASPDDGRHSIAELLSQICEIPSQAIMTSSSLSRLGIDSLMKLELCDGMRRLFPQQQLDVALVMDAETVKDLQDCVHLADEGPGLGDPTRSPNDDSLIQRSSVHGADKSGWITSSSNNQLIPPASPSPLPQSSLGDTFVSILHEITGVPESDISLNTTIGSLGVDSLLSLELSDILSDRIGQRIPHEAIHSEFRLSDLENLVSSQTSTATTDPDPGAMTPLSSTSYSPTVRATALATGSADQIPLFLFHDGGGTVGMYKSLGNLGPVNCSVFGIGNPEWVAGPHWALSLTSMAAHYATMIFSASEGETIVLGGWSFGGVLAHEVAQQLSSLGQKVQGVILIDSPCPRDHTPLPPAVIEYVLNSMRRPRAPDLKLTDDYTRSILRSQFQNHARFLSEYSHGCHDSKPSTIIPYVMLQCEDVFDTTSLCGVHYPFLEDQAARGDNNHAWEEFLNQKIPVLMIPGNHFEPFKPETTTLVSEQMQRAYRMIVDSEQ